ncbi:MULTISPECIES: hypothetical protein [Actinokineospora]|uniref:Uncharacterized protein n=1 Tax=Actinokineospora fastidiosa TaxID=1816 RepID=A0A918GBC5_9PSEU|nr:MULTISPECIES: hypothetical protein [Actinokineospora]UVS79374.1 hypothetical protein Actkin_03121 [Actinokineospora sp. UTMC 2448]GGS27993.1 hypothetical protein GCM10010171_21050 [Actinokineospora fastidiosa]
MKGVVEALGHVAAGAVLFHAGWWGGPEGFVWAGADGSAAGRVPEWEAEVLMVAERRGLVAIGRGVGSRDVPVAVTAAGLAVLGGVA